MPASPFDGGIYSLHPGTEIGEQVREVVGFFQGQDKSDLCANRMLLMATVKELEIIGEAAAKVTR